MFAAIVNMLAIIACSILGLLFKKGLSEKTQDTLMQGMGLMIIIIGAKMAVGAENDVVVVLALALGGLIGEALKLDLHMENLGVKIKNLCRISDGNFVEAFVSASLIFCVGAMAVVGSIEAAYGNYDVIYVKSALDGIIAMVLASAMGMGVAFSGAVVFVYQGAITLLAALASDVLTDTIISYLSAAGGVLIIAIGITTAGIKKFNTVNLLPGVFLAALFGGIFQLF